MESSQRTEPIAAAASAAAAAGGKIEPASGMASEAASSAPHPRTETADRAAALAAVTTLSADPVGLEFYLAVEVHYHRSRQAWFAGAHRWTMFFTILFGTAAAAQIVTPLFTGLLAAATAAADLCFDFTGRAAQHSDLARRYLAMVREFAGGKENETLCKKILSDIIDTSGDEPPVYNVAKDLAHNLAIQSLGRDMVARAVVPPSRRLWAHVCRFDSV